MENTPETFEHDNREYHRIGLLQLEDPTSNILEYWIGYDIMGSFICVVDIEDDYPLVFEDERPGLAINKAIKEMHDED